MVITKPKISIIVPVYNGEKVLKRCIDSILLQSYSNFEVIIINDGSRDKSINIINEYKEKDNRVKVIDNENRGVSESRNIGIEYSRGEYIQFVDCDDYIERDMIKDILESIENSNADLVMTGIIIDIESLNNTSTSIQTFKYKNVQGKSNIAMAVLERLDGAYVHSLWNKIFKRDIIIENNIRMDENINLGEDLIFNLEYLNKCRNVIFDDKCYYHYCMKDSESLTAKYRDDRLELMKLLYDKCYSYFVECELGLNQITVLNNLFIKWMYSCFVDLNNTQCKLTVKEKLEYIKVSRNKYSNIINNTKDMGLMLNILKQSLKCTYLSLIISKCIYIIKVRFRQILYKR